MMNHNSIARAGGVNEESAGACSTSTQSSGVTVNFWIGNCSFKVTFLLSLTGFSTGSDYKVLCKGMCKFVIRLHSVLYYTRQYYTILQVLQYMHTCTPSLFSSLPPWFSLRKTVACTLLRKLKLFCLECF